ncbi:ribonuclease BN [Rhodobacteraceae bacterium WD3A24]|nr:ribonuclease BN [Rhodobacteraceae bacterium WD3A24]
MRPLPAIRELWRISAARDLSLIAAGVAFFALLAIFPAVAAVIALWGFWADPVVVQQQLQLLREFVPPEAFALLETQIERLVGTNERGLGVASLVSLAVALWSARLGVAAVIRGMNAIMGGAQRGGVRHIVIALALTVLLMAVAIVALAAILILPVVLAFMPLGPLAESTIVAAKWGVAVGTVVVGLAILYRFGPNLPGRRTRWLSPGLGLAVALWAAASVALSRFLANFGNYNEVYGSIGAVIALLVWFYISAYAVLLGAAFNRVLRDSAMPPASDEASEALN